MAVAHDAVSESHTGTTGSVSEASFSWSHNPVGTPRGVLVFVASTSVNDNVTSVTYDGENLTLVSGAVAVDTAGEQCRTTAWFLGTGVNTTDPATVVVNRTNNANEMWAVAITVTAAADTEVPAGSIVLLEEDGTLAEQSVDDGSPGTNSVRYAAGASGLPGVPAAGASSTALIAIDFGARVAAAVQETTAGQGARSVGFADGTSDDRAFVHLAISEIAAGGTPHTASPADTLSLADARTHARGLSRTDSVALADARVHARGLSRTDTVSLADATATAKVIAKDLADTVSLTDATALGVGKLVADAVALADALSTVANKTVAIDDTVALADALAKVSTMARTLADTVALTDDDDENLASGALGLADTVALSDSFSREVAILRTQADLVAIADLFTRIVVANRIVTDAVALVDSITLSIPRAVSIADAVAVADAINAALNQMRFAYPTGMPGHIHALDAGHIDFPDTPVLQEA